ncbi:chromate transporter [Streptomyces sp. TLI_105]|uniref:chromate transporter n=1 Tax=Streptomyces sp. TLI_105 TaxID=1881019 RepID=UPI00210EAC58|nr:chromate transporter [Streptomyces sp. TLI_105]
MSKTTFSPRHNPRSGPWTAEISAPTSASPPIRPDSDPRTLLPIPASTKACAGARNSASGSAVKPTHPNPVRPRPGHPGPVVQTVAVVGYAAAAGLAGGLLIAIAAFAPSFAMVIADGPRFDSLRAKSSVQAFPTCAGPAVIGAVAGSALPLGLSRPPLASRRPGRCRADPVRGRARSRPRSPRRGRAGRGGSGLGRPFG